jgi:hypothetical protein
MRREVPENMVSELTVRGGDVIGSWFRLEFTTGNLFVGEISCGLKRQEQTDSGRGAKR